jgi:hypothetical protein
MARCAITPYSSIRKDCDKVERVILSCRNPQHYAIALVYLEHWWQSLEKRKHRISTEQYNYIRNRTETIGNILDIKRGVDYEQL